MKIKFRNVRLSKDNKLRLDMINTIIRKYQADGYVLTLRQLYYQLVSRDVIPNNVKEYAKLSGLLKEGRMGGIVDWSAIEDRLRKPSSPSAFDSPENVLDAAINQYQLPRMAGQKTYVEVWVEKDALSGVLKRVTKPYHVPILVNRGYSSASAMFDSYVRFKEAYENDQKIRILYLGDFDPSGVDMIRDIHDRIIEFFAGRLLNEDDIEVHNASEQAEILIDDHKLDFQIIPIALTKAQIKQYAPPPNPAKRTDPRSQKFIDEHGSTSWEVDALPPEVLNSILENSIRDHINITTYKKVLQQEDIDRKKLESLKDYL